MKIEYLKVHCAARLTIFLCTHNHAVAPRHWFTYWYWFKHTEHHVLIKAFLYVCLPVKWYRNGAVVGDWFRSGVDHEPHRDTLHQW